MTKEKIIMLIKIKKKSTLREISMFDNTPNKYEQNLKRKKQNGK